VLEANIIKQCRTGASECEMNSTAPRAREIRWGIRYVPELEGAFIYGDVYPSACSRTVECNDSKCQKITKPNARWPSL